MNDTQTLGSPQVQPRSVGGLSVVAAARGGVSALSDLRQSGALKALFPTPRGAGVTAVCINTGGGIAGGDRFEISATARADARLTLTTQAAERVYRAAAAVPGRVTTRLTVERGATLHWLPQETILFDGARLRRRLRIEMAEDARLLMVEPVAFGRHARGEVLRGGAFEDRVAIDRAGAPLYRDATRLSGDIAGHLARPAIASGAGAMALVVLAEPEAERHLTAARTVLPAGAGASSPAPGLLVARLLAGDSFDLRRALIPLLERLSGAALPPVWRS